MSLFWIATIASVVLALPALASMAQFNGKCHRSALSKALSLWVISALPVLFLMFARVFTDTQIDYVEIIGFQALFIYCASFLAPVLYINYENEWNNSKYFWRSFTLMLLPVVILLTTCFGYALNVVAEATTRWPLYIPVYVYLNTIILWYLSLLDTSLGLDEEYRESLKQGARDLEQGLDNILEGRK